MFSLLLLFAAALIESSVALNLPLNSSVLILPSNASSLANNSNDLVSPSLEPWPNLPFGVDVAGERFLQIFQYRHDIDPKYKVEALDALHYIKLQIEEETLHQYVFKKWYVHGRLAVHWDSPWLIDRDDALNVMDTLWKLINQHGPREIKAKLLDQFNHVLAEVWIWFGL
ncbi:hypothetical protein MMC28_001464 [Mycoblastus sanguinarius]|nr:hypothetical protein [Mycoblastus sanguinarius]